MPRSRISRFAVDPIDWNWKPVAARAANRTARIIHRRPGIAPLRSIRMVAADEADAQRIGELGQFLLGDVVKRETKLHDGEIDQMAGEGSAPGNDDVALLRQDLDDVAQPAFTELIHSAAPRNGAVKWRPASGAWSRCRRTIQWR